MRSLGIVIICISRRLSSVLMLVDLRYLLMVCRQLGSRMKKSLVLVDVTGSVGVYFPFGGGLVSWWIFRMCSSQFFFVFPYAALEGFESFFGGELPLEKFCFLDFVVLVFTAFSSSLLPPVVRISVRTVLTQVCHFFSGS